MNQRQTWPLWQCIPRQSLAELIHLQWKLYGQKLDLLTDAFREVESVEEIDRLMKEKPRYKGKVWFGG